MSATPIQADPLAAAKHRLRVAVIRATMAAVGARNPRRLIDIIIDTMGLSRREVVTDVHRSVIRDMSNHGETAAAIASYLGLSEPTIVSQRRKLGLTRHRTPKLPAAVPPLTAAQMRLIQEGMPVP